MVADEPGDDHSSEDNEADALLTDGNELDEAWPLMAEGHRGLAWEQRQVGWTVRHGGVPYPSVDV